MSKYLALLILAMTFTGTLRADAVGDQKAEERRLEDQRQQRKLDDQRVEQQRLDRQREDDRIYQKKLDDKRWDQQHGR